MKKLMVVVITAALSSAVLAVESKKITVDVKGAW